MHPSSVFNKLSPVILKCGTPSSLTLPGTVTGITTTATVASVTIDASCLYNPCIKLEFTSNIIVPDLTNATINFQVFRNCNNQFQSIPVGPQWTFITSDQTSDILTFFICDSKICSNKCCTYSVQLIATVSADGGEGRAGATTTVTIIAATLSALIVDNA